MLKTIGEHMDEYHPLKDLFILHGDMGLETRLGREAYDKIKSDAFERLVGFLG